MSRIKFTVSESNSWVSLEFNIRKRQKVNGLNGYRHFVLNIGTIRDLLVLTMIFIINNDGNLAFFVVFSSLTRPYTFDLNKDKLTHTFYPLNVYQIPFSTS